MAKKPRRKRVNPVGRPSKPIDWKLVDHLLLAHCTGAEIAAHFDMHPDTLYDRVVAEYGMLFSHYAAEKKQKGLSFVKLKQFEKAMEKDNTMLIWLGKQLLDQKENKTKEGMPNDNAISMLLESIKNPRDSEESSIVAENRILREEVEHLRAELKTIAARVLQAT